MPSPPTVVVAHTFPIVLIPNSAVTESDADKLLTARRNEGTREYPNMQENQHARFCEFRPSHTATYVHIT